MLDPGVDVDVDVVLFDLDGTLVDHELAARQAMTTLVAYHPEVFGDRPVAWARAVWRQLQEQWFPRYLDGEVTFEEHRVARMRGLWAAAGAAEPSADDALASFATYLSAYEDGWAPYDDALPCLRRLAAAGVRRGIVTNGETDQQERKLVRCGIQPLVELMVTSQEVGVSKPDPLLFRTAAERLGLPVERCAYVGDRLATDPVAAAEAGMLGVWIDRTGDGDEPAHPRVRRISGLDEL